MAHITNMEKFKGTKGKWKVKHSVSKPAFNVVGTSLGGTYKIARCPYYINHLFAKEHNDKEVDEAKANAQLISKAPEMLEMLEKCLSEFEQCKDAIWELMEYQDGWESNKDRVEEKIEKIQQLIKQATEL